MSSANVEESGTVLELYGRTAVAVARARGVRSGQYIHRGDRAEEPGAGSQDAAEGTAVHTARSTLPLLLQKERRKKELRLDLTCGVLVEKEH